MRKLLQSFLLSLILLSGGTATAATPSSLNALVVPGNLLFSDGGMGTRFLTGEFVKKISISGNQLTFEFQDSNSQIQTISHSPTFPPRTGAFSVADEAKLDGIAAGAEVNVNADWNANSGDAQILNKPTLFSGAYADLTGKPTLFSGDYNDLTNKPTIPAPVTSLPWGSITGKPAFFSGSYNDLTNKPTIPVLNQANIYAQVKEILQEGSNVTLTPNDSNSEISIAASGGGGGGGGLSSVGTDSTITGDGTAGSPLSVANPFTAADETKLDGLTGANNYVTSGSVSGTTLTLARQGLSNVVITGLPSGGGGGGLTTVERSNLAQSAVDFVEAQNPILDKWSGEVDPTTVGFTRIASQTMASPYNSANDYWMIQNGATGNAVKAGLYFENESLDYTKAVVNLDVHIERGGSNDGSTGILLGADTSAGMAWAGDASEGFGMWINRLSDGRLFWLFRNNGLAQYLSGTTAITAHNGAVLGSTVVANAAMTVPETDNRVLVQVVSAGRYVYFYVNGTHYFTADLPATWLAEYSSFGPRIAVVGDNGSISKEVRLYAMSIGTPDPLDISPDTLPMELPSVPVAAGDYVMRRASGGLRTWETAPSGGTTLPAYNQVGTQALFSRAGSLFWEVVNEVPDTPGDSAGVGHVLTVTGQNDRDYAWRAATGGGGSGLNQAQVDARVLALRSLVPTAATPVAQDRFFFTDENQSGDPLRYVTFNNLLSGFVTDDSVLDLAKASRVTGDRGKFLGISASNENSLALLDAPSGGGAANFLVDTPGTPIAASADNRDKVLYRSGRLYRNKVLHSTDPTATYRDFAATDLPAGHTWGGVVRVNPAAISVPDNRVIYTTAAGQFERKITTGGFAIWVVYDMPNWRGQATDNSDADHKVRAVGDVVFFDGKVQVVATYTARTPDHFQWVPIDALWADNENTDAIPDEKIADNSIVPAKAQASTEAQKKAWRARLASSRIGQVSAALPAVTDYNAGDLLIIGRGGTTTVTFVDLDAPLTTLTTTVAGDLIMVLSNRWTRVGNLFSGGIAAAAARSIADANKIVLDRLSVFEHISLHPSGISGTVFPEFIALELSRKIVNKTIASIAVSIGGQNVGNIIRNTSPTPPATDPAAPFNNGVSELSGGVINLVLTSQVRTNLANAVGVSNRSPQFIAGAVETTFTDGTTGYDLIHFGTNNNAYRTTAGGAVDQTARDAAAAARTVADAATTVAEATTIANQRAAAVAGPVVIISNIASFDATQDRFEDSSGNAVTVPNGSIVTLTQAIYDAAVADTQFTPNANAIFLTR